ncbi:hypothetical protein FOA52_009246 [Chlamydomonas sp. UWO 241]|nr:hypothetical protein FOA52_009246 [Chlamydomonas sp. UWO 241]
MTGATCESNNCLSCCVLSCFCSTNVCWYAKKHADFRKKYDIKGSDGMDCAQACCCFHCLLCQDANQVMTEDKEFKIPMAEL